MTSPDTQEIKYIFFRTEKTGEEPQEFLGSQSCMTIQVPSDHQEENITTEFNAKFRNGTLEADFTCDYHPTTGSLSNFQIVPGTATGGLEATDSGIISFHRVLDGQEIPVLDDNGNLFMFVQLEFGYECNVKIEGDVWGKKAVPGGEAEGVVRLSEKEREVLQLDVWGEAEREAHWAFVGMRERVGRVGGEVGVESGEGAEEEGELVRKEKEDERAAFETKEKEEEQAELGWEKKAEEQSRMAEWDMAALEEEWQIVKRGKK